MEVKENRPSVRKKWGMFGRFFCEVSVMWTEPTQGAKFKKSDFFWFDAFDISKKNKKKKKSEKYYGITTSMKK